LSNALDQRLSLRLVLISTAFAAVVLSVYWIASASCGRLSRRGAYLFSEQLRTLLLLPLNGLFIGLFSILPHAKHGRIRLIGIAGGGEGKSRFVENSRLALDLIEQYAAAQYDHVSRSILRIIDLPPNRASAAYVRALRLCQINYAALQRRFPADEQRDELVCWYAWLLVHEATHGRLHVRRVPHTSATRERIEWICNKRAWKFLHRLPAEKYPFLPDLIGQVSPFGSEWWKGP